MAGGKEIKTKIASVQNTQKITAAMEMVAAVMGYVYVQVDAVGMKDGMINEKRYRIYRAFI